MKKTVIVGLGNPILTDDSVGIKVARGLKERLDPTTADGRVVLRSGSSFSAEYRMDGLKGAVTIVELHAGGVRLMDAIAGYERAFIVDAVVSDGHPPGTIHHLCPSDIICSKNSSSAHDMDLLTALGLGALLGLQLPGEISIWGIEAEDVETFGEDLTGRVKDSVPQVIEEITAKLCQKNVSDLIEKAQGVL